MKVIFEASNGTRFATEQECVAYETSISEDKEIMALLMSFSSNSQFRRDVEWFFQNHKEKIREILTLPDKDDGWISNENNAFCYPPISGSTKIKVKYRNGAFDLGIADMWSAGWQSTDNHPNDIVKYKVIYD